MVSVLAIGTPEVVMQLLQQALSLAQLLIQLLTKFDSSAAELVQQLLPDVAQAQEQQQPDAVLQQLASFADAVVAQLPLRWTCNNPGCMNLQQGSELALVRSKVNRCSGCRRARYCCRTCQVAHWKSHKPVCRAIKAAAAVPAGTVAAATVSR
jgi:hypothetical protein